MNRTFALLFVVMLLDSCAELISDNKIKEFNTPILEIFISPDQSELRECYEYRIEAEGGEVSVIAFYKNNKAKDEINAYIDCYEVNGMLQSGSVRSDFFTVKSTKKNNLQMKFTFDVAPNKTSEDVYIGVTLLDTTFPGSNVQYAIARFVIIQPAATS